MEQQRYESLAQAGERTGISRKTLRRRIASGLLQRAAHPARPSRGRRRCCARSGSGDDETRVSRRGTI